MKKVKQKTNPNRRPITAAMLYKERKRDVDSFLLISLFALCECGADADFINRFERKFRMTQDLVSSGKLPAEALIEIVTKEYKEKLEKINSEFWAGI